MKIQQILQNIRRRTTRMENKNINTTVKLHWNELEIQVVHRLKMLMSSIKFVLV